MQVVIPEKFVTLKKVKSLERVEKSHVKTLEKRPVKSAHAVVLDKVTKVPKKKVVNKETISEPKQKSKEEAQEKKRERAEEKVIRM